MIHQYITKPVYKIKELQQLVSRSRSGIYQEIKAGRLKTCHMGKSMYFMADDIVNWLEGMREWGWKGD